MNEVLNYLDLSKQNYEQKWFDIILELCQTLDISIDQFKKIDLNDKDTYRFIQNEDVSDIYHLDNEQMGELMEEFISKFKPNSFEELKSMLVLFRPSPLEAGLVDQYLANKQNKEYTSIKIDGFNSVLEPILCKSYGVILYHQQILSIIQKVCGVSLKQAEEMKTEFLSNISSKEKNILKDQFFRLTIPNGYSYEVSDKLFDMIYLSTPPSYDENHVISHAKITFYLAYFKTHYLEKYIEIINQYSKD